MMVTLRDVNGREVMAGDLIRVYHYVDRRTRRKCYMHKVVSRVNGTLEICRDGQHLFAVDVTDIVEQQSFEKAHKARIDCLGEFEIIDGPATRRPDRSLETWYERAKVL